MLALQPYLLLSFLLLLAHFRIVEAETQDKFNAAKIYARDTEAFSEAELNDDKMPIARFALSYSYLFNIAANHRRSRYPTTRRSLRVR